jgi:DNA-3-methyladenine glycosylase I
VERLLGNAGIIRHRGKIEATIGNAQAWLNVEEREGFNNYLWKYVDGKPLANRFENMTDVPTQTSLSLQLSKDLKKEGFKFCGPTIVYAFMEAVGMANDHMITCPRHGEVAKLAR